MQAKITLKIEKKTFTKLQPSTIYSMTTKRPFIIEVFHVERRSVLHIETNTSGIIKKRMYTHICLHLQKTHTHTLLQWRQEKQLLHVMIMMMRMLLLMVDDDGTLH